ncbi:MAG TPA: hypothetical protein VEH31_09515 [Streptosporangiaceae bacterium]|nr:hypothetical protein [Streptosporangiaceae bacterium]
MADDSRVPPLPRRTPDGKRHVPGGESGWGSGFTQPLVLPEPIRQRIRAALDYGGDEAPPERRVPQEEHGAPQEEHAAPQEEHAAAGVAAGRPASLPRRVPGANNAPEPPAQIARPAMQPSLVHLTPAEPVAAVPAATLGAIAAAAGTPSDVAPRPQPAIALPAEPPLVPAQRSPAQPQPDGHDRRDVAGNKARRASLATPMTRAAMWAYLAQAEAPTEPLPAIPATGAPAVPVQRAPAEQARGQPAQRDATTAGPEEETAVRDEALSYTENGQASVGRPQLHGTKGLTRRAGESPPWAPVPPPAMAPPKFTPPKSVSPKPVLSQPVSAQSGPTEPAPPQPGAPEAPAPSPEPVARPERPRLGRGVKAGMALALVLALAGSLPFLLKRPGGTARAIAPPAGPSASAAPGTAAEVRAATAAWVASQVSRARPISCDPAMCRALRADGVPAADLMVLRPGGGNPLRSGVIVATPAVTRMVGTELLTADAPAAIASFGSGSGQVSVRVIFPQGAAAYAAALRQDIADRKANESTLLENPRVTALPSARRQLQGGQVDSRLLLTLAQLASQWPLSIVAFGDRAPGASPGVPLRSAELAVTGNVAGRAGQMAAFAHQLQGNFADARIRVVHLASGQNVVQVAFAAPSPLGELGN